MDIYCPNCAEPWDNDCIHEEVATRRNNGDKDSNYTKVMREFQRKGCSALATAYGLAEGVMCETAALYPDRTRALLASVAYEMLGDDMDGAASMLDDYFYAHNL